MRVWLAEHVHEFDDGHEDFTLLGIYSSRERAEAAVESVREQPGFRDHPDGFAISECEVDPQRVGWPEGFSTISDPRLRLRP